MTDTFGRIFRLTDWGDTHGAAMEGVLEGCPANIAVDMDFIRQEMARRAPGRDMVSTQRRESDQVLFLSGIKDGVTTGGPISFRVPNNDVKPNEANRNVIRPGHASYVYYKKYGYKDNELNGRASARQTVCRVVAGAIAKLALKQYGVEIEASVAEQNFAGIREGDTFGARVEGAIRNIPAGLGEPVYDKFSARLAYAMMSINAAKGFEIGEGFKAAAMCGSEYLDYQDPDFTYKTNHDGGVQAGITNGQDVNFAVAFKPIPSVRFDQQTIDFDGNPAVCKGSNRNDLCVAPRVLPVVEAMAAMVTLDFILINTENTETTK